MNTLISILISATITIGAIPYTDIEKGFNENKAKHIIKSSNEKIIINIIGDEGVYSKTQAELILQNFFTKKPSGKFRFIFKGKETTEGTFAIGKYNTNSESFRVTLQFKPISHTSFSLESLTIERN